jgi:hypothetical protein
MNSLKHYWNVQAANEKKLKEARLQYYNRKSSEWHKNDELTHLVNRNKHRVNRGIPLEFPNMKPWSFVKGRVKV